MTLVTAIADRLEEKTDRRGFIGRIAMWGAAMVTAPTVFALTPTTAYAAVCACNNQSCDCNSKCCGGYTEFCCTIYGENACPPGGVIGGWWKVDESSFCGDNARYYMDCHSACGDCTCGSTGVCSGTCTGTECSCGSHDCRNRKAGCTHFRYGNCNNDVTCVGPIICRVVTCTLPWQVDAGCSTAVRVDNDTRYHDSPCLHAGIDPIGFLEAIETAHGSATVRGWALDIDSDSPVGIHIYADGEFASGGRTMIPRRDVQSVFGTATDLLGYEFELSLDSGTRRICVYAINIGGGSNRLLGCQTVSVPTGTPRGHVESIEPAEMGVRVSGWAFDVTEGVGPSQIQVLAGSDVIATFEADRSRYDVQNAFGLDSSRVGFDEIVPAIDGSAAYCIRVVDQGNDGSDITIGCRDMTLERDPHGWLDSVQRIDIEVRIRGWAVDPDSSEPVGIHVYADSTFLGGAKADRPRPDVAAALGIGPNHGFDFELPLHEEARTIRVFAINQGPGRNSLIGAVEL